MEQEQSINNQHLKGSLTQLEFVNTAIHSLPIEENAENSSHRVSGYNYSRVNPTPKDNPRVVSLSAPSLELLDLDKDQLEKDSDTPHYLVGNKLIPSSDPIAHCYCGHQFGSFAGQLGDGRAITLGDIRNHKGELWELQLKGPGPTPYSRFSDGLAVLRSSLREYLCSEAMWALGIPTTRAASLIVTDSLAVRDPLYNGRRIHEKCAVVMRLAPTFWRFGSFEIFKKSGPSSELENKMMPAMLDYLLSYFPEIAKLEKEKNYSKQECYLEMYYEIVRRTAYLVALWQCYGFCHGVLNTDNMSALGLTLDYGPFGWMDFFNKEHICNHSDQDGRYSYANQPSIGKWNLMKLAEALQSHLPIQKMKNYVDSEYDNIFQKHYYEKMRQKTNISQLGLYCVESEEDIKLIDDLFDVMHDNGSDFTITFRKLSSILIPQKQSESTISEEIIQEFTDLSPGKDMIAERYRPHLSQEKLTQLKSLMKYKMNYFVAMGLSPAIIEQEEEKMKKYKEFLNVDEAQSKGDIKERWRQWLKKYEKRLLLESSGMEIEEETKENSQRTIVIKNKFSSFKELQDNRIKMMNKTNPVYILRNYVAEDVIRKAEKGDYTGVNNLLDLLLNPFEDREDTYESKEYKKLPPKWAAEICVSCSS